MDIRSGSISVVCGMQGMRICISPDQPYTFEYDSDYSEESDDTAGREFMRSPRPEKNANMSTVEVTTTPSASPPYS